MPRFSIVIPTRNRQDLVPISLQSVLEQDFRDFEVIVSDNSDLNIASEVRRKLGTLLDDPRVRYVQPSTVLPMTAHWEWAVGQTCGEFIGILTDRMVLRLNTLAVVDSILRERKLKLICFERTKIKEKSGTFSIPRTSDKIEVRFHRSKEVIDHFSRSDFRPLDNPRFLNGFCSRELLDVFRSEYGSVFTGISPDYSFLMRCLDHFDEYGFICNAQLLKHSENRSNGKSFSTLEMNAAARDFLEKVRSEQAHFFQYAPIPEDIRLITNLMAMEYEIGRVGQKSGKFSPLSKQHFYVESMRYLQERRTDGIDVAVFEEMMERYRVQNHLSAYQLPSGSSWRVAAGRVSKLMGKLRGRKPVSKQSASESRETIIEALRADAVAPGP